LPRSLLFQLGKQNREENMKKKTAIPVILAVAVAFWFAPVSVAQAGQYDGLWTVQELPGRVFVA
jgi:hypothetical protein